MRVSSINDGAAFLSQPHDLTQPALYLVLDAALGGGNSCPAPCRSGRRRLWSVYRLARS